MTARMKYRTGLHNALLEIESSEGVSVAVEDAPAKYATDFERQRAEADSIRYVVKNGSWLDQKTFEPKIRTLNEWIRWSGGPVDHLIHDGLLARV
jgi:hypothetical protein